MQNSMKKGDGNRMFSTYSLDKHLTELNQCPDYPCINNLELAEKLSALNEFGSTPEGGFSRPPLSDAERGAVSLFKSWMKEIGLDVWEDEAGNLFGKWEGSDPSLPCIMTGSHVDTVPNGGAFDGALGCLSSLMAVKALKEKGYKPRRSIEIVIFLDEEGSRFHHGLFGSQVLMGEVEPESLHHYKDETGISMHQAMAEAGLDPDNLKKAKRNPEDIHFFLELHIEQGKQLENENLQIGVVSGIAGPSWRNFTFTGSTDHAGNTPMDMRADALACAAHFITEVEKLPQTVSETAVATVGRIQAFPNGTNVVAGKAVVDVDVRDISIESRDGLLEKITAKAKEVASGRKLEVEVKKGIEIAPVPVKKSIQEKMEEIAERQGFAYKVLPSGAGHDMMNIGKYTDGGMIFVPSHNGKSHSPEEWTPLPDCVRGVKMMVEYLKVFSS
jgi:allantoate deiminase